MTPRDLLREDAEARRRALDVTRSVIVQAPAGSGKTELLTQRFLALLAVVDKPEALLALTFTLKAAAEMRERILDALRRCEDPNADLLDTTRTLARAVIKVDAEREWGLLRNSSRLRVLTIDALNQSLARRLPVLSGLGAGLGVDEDGEKLYAQAAERLLTHLPADDARTAQAVATVLEHLDNNVEQLVQLIADMLARREAWLPVLPADVEAYGDEGAVRDELEAGRRDIVAAHLAALREAFPSHLLAQLSADAHESGQILRRVGKPSFICDCGPGDLCQCQYRFRSNRLSRNDFGKACSRGYGYGTEASCRPDRRTEAGSGLARYQFGVEIRTRCTAWNRERTCGSDHQRSPLQGQG